jgi:hypothetical protein
MIRFLEPEDVPKIERIYDRYFPDMERPDFTQFHCVYVVTDDDNNIISIGGIKPLAEAVVLTDRSFSVRKRMNALYEIHTALVYSADKLGFDRLHAFAFEDKYIDHLIKRMKFREVKDSKLLILELKDGQEERRSCTTADRITN